MKIQLAIIGSVLAAAAAQAQLVPGGDFEVILPNGSNASTYFTTDYNFISTVPAINAANNLALDGAGRLTVNSNPFEMAPTWSSIVASPNVPGSQFLIVNGAERAGAVVWNLASAQHIPVVAGQSYFFEAYYANINTVFGNLGTLTFQLRFSPDNVNFGANQVLGTPNVQATGVGQWDVLTNPAWIAPNNGWVDLEIVNANTAFAGNDFLIDNINFGKTLVPEASSFVPVLAMLGLGGLYIARRKR